MHNIFRGEGFQGYTHLFTRVGPVSVLPGGGRGRSPFSGAEGAVLECFSQISRKNAREMQYKVISKTSGSKVFLENAYRVTRKHAKKSREFKKNPF